MLCSGVWGWGTRHGSPPPPQTLTLAVPAPAPQPRLDPRGTHSAALGWGQARGF